MSKNKDSQYYWQLAHKWIAGTITEEEERLLETWYREEQVEVSVPAELANNEASHSEKIFAEIHKELNKKRGHGKRIAMNRYKWKVAAAVSIMVIVTGLAFFYSNKNTPLPIHATVKEIMPGTNGAILHLWNGKDIVLDSTDYGGRIASVYEQQIFPPDNGMKANYYNVLATPNGKQWKMVLPDGTTVFLNAGSALRFPASFIGKRERLVELTGEAYFDVIHDAGQPFKVKAGNAIIEDVGTVFNVSNYTGEKIKATLIKGAIKIGSHVLKPGQQAIAVDNAKVKVKTVDVHNAAAWVEGQFSMDNLTVQELMNQLSRWYNIPVEYIGTPPSESFGGLLDRNEPLSNILSVLNTDGINATIKNGKIIVSFK